MQAQKKSLRVAMFMSNVCARLGRGCKVVKKLQNSLDFHFVVLVGFDMLGLRCFACVASLREGY